MEKMNFKKKFIKNLMCYCFDGIIKIDDFDIGDI